MNHEPRTAKRPADTGPPPNLSLPRALRLGRKNDIDRVFRQGRRWRHRGTLVIAYENGLGFSRMAVLVAKKKHHKSAVVRNRLRRLAREAFRHERRRLNRGYDLAILPAQEPSLWTFADMREALAVIFDRIEKIPARPVKDEGRGK